MIDGQPKLGNSDLNVQITKKWLFCSKLGMLMPLSREQNLIQSGTLASIAIAEDVTTGNGNGNDNNGSKTLLVRRWERDISDA